MDTTREDFEELKGKKKGSNLIVKVELSRQGSSSRHGYWKIRLAEGAIRSFFRTDPDLELVELERRGTSIWVEAEGDVSEEKLKWKLEEEANKALGRKKWA